MVLVEKDGFMLSAICERREGGVGDFQRRGFEASNIPSDCPVTDASGEKKMKTLYVPERKQWRKWLEKNHGRENEVWLIYYKNGKPSIRYNDSVEEALCFGWIDSIIKKIDEERYVRKFTPRKNDSNWSALNIKRARKMIQEGRMTETGLAKINESLLKDNSKIDTKRRAWKAPPFLRKALMKSMIAWKNFNRLAPTYKQDIIRWVSDAKKDETRQRRIIEIIGLLEKNRKLGMK